MNDIIKHINDTNASYRALGAGDAKNTDLFLDNEHYALFKDCGEHIAVRFDYTNLSQAVLFISSILPRKYDNSSVHKVVSYTTDFVFDQLALLDAFFTIDGKRMQKRTQVWNARKDVPKKNGEIDNRFYFNGLIEEIEYTNSKGAQTKSKFTIRNYFAGGYSDLHISKADDGIFDILITNTLQPYQDDKEAGTEIVYNGGKKSLQRIYYGAPGTGKSNEIKLLTGEGKDGIKFSKDFTFRTTFHPDSDYSTFVGAYKPIWSKKEEKIVYEFRPQTFLKAYIAAWTHPEENIALVIEEINRGNCAQIFGDIFQLLDREKDGLSKYPIEADIDMQNFLAKALSGGLEEKWAGTIDEEDKAAINAYYEKHYDDAFEKIKNGEILALPKNLSLLATMNTSDQSLFPMDSAFKRRWEWIYQPIVDAEKGWKIEVGNKYELVDWWEFVKRINKIIATLTTSEDKQLGYFFCIPDEFVEKDETKRAADAEPDLISAKNFVGKVLFYLWNDVFKDYAFDEKCCKDTNGKEVLYAQFYKDNNNINIDTLVQFFNQLKEDNEESLLIAKIKDTSAHKPPMPTIDSVQKQEEQNLIGFTDDDFDIE